MAVFIEERFRVQIFLDTNILVDYILGTIPLLTESLNFLSKCDFVTLRSSHYVEFEMVEVLKKIYFYHIVRKSWPSAQAKKDIVNWSLDGDDYTNYSKDITQTIYKDIQKIVDNLGINFNKHILHKNLLLPACNICLSSRISREDSMVLVSSVFPDEDDRLENVIILSNDAQYAESYANNMKMVTQYLGDCPEFIHIRKIKYGTSKINLEKSIPKNTTIEKIWRENILSILKKHQDYIGETYRYKTKKIPINKCIFFKTEKDILKDVKCLYVILKDLSGVIYLDVSHQDENGRSVFWNDNTQISLPFKITRCSQFSFIPDGITDEQLSYLQENGNLIFYDE